MMQVQLLQMLCQSFLILQSAREHHLFAGSMKPDHLNTLLRHIAQADS